MVAISQHTITSISGASLPLLKVDCGISQLVKRRPAAALVAQQHRLPHRLTMGNATARHRNDASEALTPACQSHVCIPGSRKAKTRIPIVCYK